MNINISSIRMVVVINDVDGYTLRGTSLGSVVRLLISSLVCSFFSHICTFRTVVMLGLFYSIFCFISCSWWFRMNPVCWVVWICTSMSETCVPVESDVSNTTNASRGSSTINTKKSSSLSFIFKSTILYRPYFYVVPDFSHLPNQNDLNRFSIIFELILYQLHRLYNTGSNNWAAEGFRHYWSAYLLLAVWLLKL